MSTYKSLGVVVDALKASQVRPDIACFDEAHHIVKEGKATHADVLAQLCQRAFYFTATPPMAMKLAIGSASRHNYSLPEAIKDGICSSWDLNVLWCRIWGSERQGPPNCRARGGSHGLLQDGQQPNLVEVWPR